MQFVEPPHARTQLRLDTFSKPCNDDGEKPSIQVLSVIGGMFEIVGEIGVFEYPAEGSNQNIQDWMRRNTAKVDQHESSRNVRERMPSGCVRPINRNGTCFCEHDVVRVKIAMEKDIIVR